MFKSIFGGLAAAFLLLATVWVCFGGAIKTFAPHLIGYEHLGWRHAGAKTIKTVRIPKWLGPDTILSIAAAPFRQHKVYLLKGDAIVIDYDAAIDRGGLSLSVYRTNYSTLFQGPLVEDHQAWRLDKGVHKGTFAYVAGRDGFYQFSNRVRWEPCSGCALPMPDYDLVFKYRWRIRHHADSAASS